MSNYDLAKVERPPDWHFSYRDTLALCGALRRYLYGPSRFGRMEIGDDELEELLDRLFQYASHRHRWENLYLPPKDEVPF